MAELSQIERTYPVVLPHPRFSRQDFKKRMRTGGIYKIGLNWAPFLRKLGTTISSSTWSITGSGSSGGVTLSSAASTTLTTSVLVTVTASGDVTELKNTIIMADGQKETIKYLLIIDDPDAGYTTDYEI
jgi:hypothetical protein